MPDYENLLNRGLEENLPVTYTDGKLRVTTDKLNLYLDLESSRIKITDVITAYTQSQILALQNPIPSKLYVASDTGKVYARLANKWVYSGDCNLTEADDTESSNDVVWFSKTDDNQPEYDTTVRFNPYTKEFSVQKLKVNGMLVTVTTNNDGSHTTLFSF